MELFFCGKNLTRCENWKKLAPFLKLSPMQHLFASIMHYVWVTVRSIIFLWEKLKCKIQLRQVAELANFFSRNDMNANDINTEYHRVKIPYLWIRKVFPRVNNFYHSVFISSKNLLAKFGCEYISIRKSNIFEQHRLDMQDFGLEMQVTM